VYRYDVAKAARGARLEVVRHTSFWKPELGPQWYVVYRDLAREGTLERREECVRPSFALPEWAGRPGATLADLPFVHTRRPH
jgi:hypothetical protein